MYKVSKSYCKKHHPSITHVVFAIGSLDSSGAQTSNIGTSKSFRNGQAELLLAAEDLVGNLLLPGLVVGKIEDAGQANAHAGHVTVHEAAHHGSRHFLGDNHVVEVVKLLALDSAAEQLDTVEVLAGAETHVQQTDAAHVVNHVLTNVAAGGLAVLGLGCQVLVSEDADGLAQRMVRLLVEGALEDGVEPEGLGVGNRAEVTGLGSDDFGGLALDGANGQVGVFCENLVSVQVVEGSGGILAGNLLEDGLATGMGKDELGEVVDGVVNHAPERILRSVLAHLVTGKGLCGRSHCLSYVCSTWT